MCECCLLAVGKCMHIWPHSCTLGLLALLTLPHTHFSLLSTHHDPTCRNEDAIVIINAEGSIMMVSQGVTPLFGYTKAELEGQNVSMLMPPPFSQRHNGYLQHYKETGDVNILDQVKEVVALHNERRVFPVQMWVLGASGEQGG